MITVDRWSLDGSTYFNVVEMMKCICIAHAIVVTTTGGRMYVHVSFNA